MRSIVKISGFLVALFIFVGVAVIYSACSCSEDKTSQTDDGGRQDAGTGKEDACIFDCEKDAGSECPEGYSKDEDGDCILVCEGDKIDVGGMCACTEGKYEDKDGNCVTCKEGEEWNERRKQCQVHRCASDYECCPHFGCNAGGQCVTRFVACTEDAKCDEAIKGQACINGYCSYKSCNATSDCDGDMNCFNNYCVAKAPCKSKCNEGEVCITPLDECFPIPRIRDEENPYFRYTETSAIEGCDQTCAEGTLMVYTDPSVTFTEQCATAHCSCEPIPPVPFGDMSLHNSIGLLNGEIVASAYNQTYTDLVLLHFNTAGEADVTTAEIIDGVPENGEIVGDPGEFRGGVADPGPNVGLYTSLVVDSAGNMHISYYDQDNTNLKYARKTIGSDKWEIETVDDKGDNGRFSDMVVLPADNLAITYFVDNDGTGNSAIRVMSRPATSTEQWVLAYEETAPLVGPACGAKCTEGQVCVSVNDVETCVAEATGCPSECESTQACVDTGAGPACTDLLTDVKNAQVPEGLGVMPDIAAYTDGRVALCFYDNRMADKANKVYKGDLVLVVAGTDGTVVRGVIDGNAALDGSGEDNGDVGRYCSVAFSPDGTKIGVAYQDATSHNVKFWSGTDPLNGASVIVAEGNVGPGEEYFIGSDNALIFDPSGNPRVAYQDATRHILFYATSNNGGTTWGTPEILKQPENDEGAWGFFTNQIADAMAAYVSTVGIYWKNKDDPAGPKPDNKFIVIKKTF